MAADPFFKSLVLALNSFDFLSPSLCVDFLLVPPPYKGFFLFCQTWEIVPINPLLIGLVV